MSEKNSIKKLEFVITDKNGVSVKSGDEIFVQLKCCEYDPYNGEGFYCSSKLIKASLRLQLSRGLVVKVLEIIEDDEPDEDQLPLEIGRIMSFKRIAWDWWK